MNKISFLKNEDGAIVEWGSGLKEAMLNYFSNLITTTDIAFSEVTNYVFSRVNEDQNVAMLAPVDPKEVKSALFSMHPDKSPGPDGMSPDFYQKYWQIVGEDIVELIQHFFNRKI